MARIVKRIWTSPGPTGRKVKHACFGYTLMVGGKRERKFSSEWQTEGDALRALVAVRKRSQRGGSPDQSRR